MLIIKWIIPYSKLFYWSLTAMYEIILFAELCNMITQGKYVFRMIDIRGRPLNVNDLGAEEIEKKNSRHFSRKFGKASPRKKNVERPSAGKRNLERKNISRKK